MSVGPAAVWSAVRAIALGLTEAPRVTDEELKTFFSFGTAGGR
jgi:hypothetical protein